MSVDAQQSASAESPTELKRAITGRLLFFYVLGDVLGSGIYVLDRVLSPGRWAARSGRRSRWA